MAAAPDVAPVAAGAAPVAAGAVPVAAGAAPVAAAAPRRRTRAATLARLLRVARPEAGLLAGGVVFLAIGAGTALLYPMGMRLVIDVALGHPPAALATFAGFADVPRARLLTWVALAMAVVAAVQGLAIWGRVYLVTVAGERAVARLREQLYRGILDQEVAFFDGERTGDLTSRLSSDTAVLQSAVSANLSMGLRNLVQGLGAGALLLYTSPRLALVMFAVVPAIAVSAVVYGRRVRRLSKEVQDVLAESSAVAEESIGALRTVRSFAAEAMEAERYRVANQRAFAIGRRRAAMSSKFLGATSFAGYAAAALVFWYGGRLVERGEMTAGGLTSFLVYTLLVGVSLGTLADLWAELMKALGAAERVFELLDRQPAIATAGGASLPSVAGRVELVDVSFAYPLRPDAPVLAGVSLAIEPGQIVALVGPSGAGKSTVAALLARFYDPDAGALLLDGHDLRALDPSWLRRQIGTVAQEPILFSTSIAENIRYGRPGASLDEVRAAARAAHADAFVTRFPDGYDTLVGERGVQLSGGQKQRVAIARAVLKDPRILILDEATSALDAESEHLVKEALDHLMRGRTTLVIAHRLSTVMGADRVLVLDGGALVEQGTHATLMQSPGGLYRRLVERQFVPA